MALAKKACFVIMPFRADSKYMYLYMKQHIESHHQMVCERGDSSYDQAGILEKIQRYVQDADVIIADCTGRNPNVMYELGMAHMQKKPVILITSDAVEKAPTDIRSFEFIRYDLTEEDGFIAKLDAALDKIVGTYDVLYDAARKLFLQFREDSKVPVPEASKETFIQAAAVRARSSSLPDPADEKEVARQLLFAMGTGWDIDMNQKASDWIKQKFPA
jgi:nucleoside 2-deoxyribosyltransferase